MLPMQWRSNLAGHARRGFGSRSRHEKHRVSQDRQAGDEGSRGRHFAELGVAPETGAGGPEPVEVHEGGEAQPAFDGWPGQVVCPGREATRGPRGTLHAPRELAALIEQPLAAAQPGQQVVPATRRQRRAQDVQPWAVAGCHTHGSVWACLLAIAGLGIAAGRASRGPLTPGPSPARGEG
jgi:hypothetical protein